VKDATTILNPSPDVSVEVTLKDCIVNMDKELLRYIFTNLISNAIKFSNIDAQIKVHASDAPDNGIMLRIEDRGIGIPVRDLETIFEPFHRGQNVAGYHGTGLGLSIVKKCVDLHKGSVNIESTLAKGTIVTVTLPRSMN
jgi:signal transduction histidine kinase